VLPGSGSVGVLLRQSGRLNVLPLRLPLAFSCTLAVLVGCSGSSSEPQNWPAPEPLHWVDPARCLSPCSYDGAGHLARIDSVGEIAAGGAFQVLEVARPALAAMLAAVSSAGHPATVGSAFRTYDEQLQLYEAATEIGRTARPGHSEHQLGAAVDLDDRDGSAFAWLAERSAEYGFLLSYPAHLQKTTGLRYEPWHFRYVGSEMARAVRTETTTLEAYLHAHPAGAPAGDCSDCVSDLSRSECGALTLEGECRGSVLVWCFDGALAEVDCGTTGLVCDIGTAGADCF